MEFDAEFYVTLGFLVFLCLLGYLGVHRMVLNGLDSRGKQIAAELAQATKLREEAVALLADIPIAPNLLTSIRPDRLTGPFWWSTSVRSTRS